MTTPIRTTDVAAFPAELFLWLSPAFPVGGFAFSHGLEKLVDDGIVSDRASLGAWLTDLATSGSLRNDLLLLAEAWQAGQAKDTARLTAVAELAAALQPGAERQLETLTQGRGFGAACTAAWDVPSVALLMKTNRLAYPVAVGAAAADRNIPLAPTLDAYALGFCSNLMSAAIRLSVIGQFDGQRVLADLLPALKTAAHEAASGDLDDLGGACFASDLASLAHETQHVRLFRS
ncbi:urease accessory protein UreF [Elstera sp.]|jgi:urease accessory protein|uniref:urease accessory protein UreF n=1 Tax=Elstera sp. TaxID=1916664 RepID=UPI0037C0E45A